MRCASPLSRAADSVFPAPLFLKTAQTTQTFERSAFFLAISSTYLVQILCGFHFLPRTNDTKPGTKPHKHKVVALLQPSLICALMESYKVLLRLNHTRTQPARAHKHITGIKGVGGRSPPVGLVLVISNILDGRVPAHPAWPTLTFALECPARRLALIGYDGRGVLMALRWRLIDVRGRDSNDEVCRDVTLREARLFRR